MNYDTMFFLKCLHFITAIQWMSALGHFIRTLYIYIYTYYFAEYIYHIHTKISTLQSKRGYSNELTSLYTFLTGYFSITFVNSVVQAISVLHFHSYKSEI